MKNFERRIRKIDEKVRNTALDASLDVSAVEKACSKGDVALAAKLLAEHLEKRFAKLRNKQDPAVWTVLTDKVLRELSDEALYRIKDYWDNEPKK